MRRLAPVWAALLLGGAACRLESRDDYLGDKAPTQFAIGRAATPDDIAQIDVDVSPTGEGLPEGSGTPQVGATVYASRCASCHGANGEGKPPGTLRLVGGDSALDSATAARASRTVRGAWPYATTLFDYIRRAMPLSAPGSLTEDETYAVTAYLLERDGLVPASARLDATTLTAVHMPARDRIVSDDRRGSVGGRAAR